MVSIGFAASSILEQALEIFTSNEHTANHITEILILTDYENFLNQDAISQTFLLEAQNTPASSAKLVFEQAKPHLTCQFCGKIFLYPATNSIHGFSLNCPRCGSEDTQLMNFDVIVKKIKVV